MTKSIAELKQLSSNALRRRLAEVAQPKPEDEKRFVDKHTIEFWDHPVALPSQFTGEIQKDMSRPADYQPGEDEDVYESKNDNEKYPWSKINQAFMNAGFSPSQILKILSSLNKQTNKDSEKSGDNKTYTWGRINNALISVGTTPSRILTVMSSLNKTMRESAKVGEDDDHYEEKARAKRRAAAKAADARKDMKRNVYGSALGKLKEASADGDLKHMIDDKKGPATLAWARKVEAEKRRLAAEKRKKPLGEAKLQEISSELARRAAVAADKKTDGHIKTLVKLNRGWKNKVIGDDSEKARAERTTYRKALDDKEKSIDQRHKFNNYANKKLGEETLAEIAKSTLQSYVKKSYDNYDAHSSAAMKLHRADRKDNPKTYTQDTPISAGRAKEYGDHTRQMNKRKTGMTQTRARLNKESYLDEAFTAGELTFGDKSRVVVKEQEAQLLNRLFKTLKGDTQNEMVSHVNKSSKNFRAVLEFAAEAVGK